MWRGSGDAAREDINLERASGDTWIPEQTEQFRRGRYVWLADRRTGLSERYTELACI
jgi:hypothetical protein